MSGGTKDLESSSPRDRTDGRYDPTGALVPYLAEEIPNSREWGVSADLKIDHLETQFKLLWSDGTAVTSADVKFSADYRLHPDMGCASLSYFDGVQSVDIVDNLTVKALRPSLTLYGPFMGYTTPIIQKAQFENCTRGPRRRTVPNKTLDQLANGPFVVTDFKPNDVIQMKANDNYRDANKPVLASLTFKGGGDATGAGRSVLETGEFDYAWNLQLAPDVIANMEKAGKGVGNGFGPLVERIEMNLTDPSPSLDADTRSTRKAPHPFLTDINVRKAMSMQVIDRPLLVEIGYGKAGRVNVRPSPSPDNYAANNDYCVKQDIDGANALLDLLVERSRWSKNQRRYAFIGTVSNIKSNAVRQDFQALIKEWWVQIGVETELRNLSASVFFGGDPGLPDTFQKFYAGCRNVCEYL